MSDEAESPQTEAGATTEIPGAAFAGVSEAAAGRRAGVVSGAAAPSTYDFLLDVRLAVSVEVGRVPLTVREVMDLRPGSVIELEHGAAEPVEIHANGRCIGHGEIVVVGEQFGVRVTELGTPS